jgi:hypothetical protein
MLQWFLAVALVGVIGINAEAADKAKKKKTDEAPAGYSKVTFVDLDKKTFNVFGDDTKYTFTDKTTNYEKIATGAFVKLTLADGSKTAVNSVDVAPATPAKKKKKDNNN